MPDADKQTAPRSPAPVSPKRGAGSSEPEIRFLCPECQAPAADLEAHLRQAHHIYAFRGTKRSYQETVSLLLQLVLAPRPDPEAWDTLSAIAHEEHGARAEFYLASLLGQSLGRLSPERRTHAVAGLGQAIARSGAARLIAVLASDAELPSQHLALAALAHLEPPLPAELHQPLRGLLLDRRLPAELQVAATAVLVRGAGADSPLAADFLEKLTIGLGKAKSIERLRQLEQLVGPTGAIDGLCSVLEDRLRMICPRCQVELRRPEMAQHLWQQHQLVLDGRRVRDPWSVIEDWLDAYRARGVPELLERCRLLAQHLEGDHGLVRIDRLMAARGIRNADAHRALVEDARKAHASLCPECYALVSVPQALPPFFINQYRGRLSARGYRVEIDEHGLRTRLEVALPSGPVLRGPEPHRRWTRQGATVFLISPLVALALAVAVGLPPLGEAPLAPVLLLAVTAFLAELLVRWAWRPRHPPQERACHYAWTLLAPRLHAGGFDRHDSAFLAGLARQSGGHGYSLVRARLLADLAQRTEAAVLKKEAPTDHLAALRRLQAEDAARAGEDPVPPVARSLARCFAGQLPFSYAQELLQGWQTDLWSRGNLVRLRVLLCDAAFETGFEVRPLLDAARTAPALAGALDTEHVERLAALRLLWSLRAGRPWARCGPAKSVFELADDPRWARLLGRYPDLLLLQDEPDWPPLAPAGGEAEPVRILLCGRGVVLQDVLFEAEPPLVDVVNRPGSTEVLFSPHRFRARARTEALVSCMERWFRWAFREFLPQVGRAASWEEPDRAARLRALGAVSCPHCHHPLLPRVGEVGLSFDEEAPRTG
jgi:hypothetical protein